VIDVLLRAVAVGVGIGLGRELVAPRGDTGVSTTPPGWYADPWRQHALRWWNGQWTGYTHD
jgi:Protein of unknown function (DUF2510)